MYPQAVMCCYRAAAEVSPSPEMQASFRRMMDAMRSEGHTDEEICLALLEASADGLRNNNWPTN